MGEIEKLYRNCNIESIGFDTAHLQDEYPPFTEEKQFKLIKWLARNKSGVMIAFSTLESDEYNVSTGYYHCAKHIANYKSDENLGITIVTFINDLWEDLTTEEKEEIKEILK